MTKQLIKLRVKQNDLEIFKNEEKHLMTFFQFFSLGVQNSSELTHEKSYL